MSVRKLTCEECMPRTSCTSDVACNSYYLYCDTWVARHLLYSVARLRNEAQLEELE